MYKDYIVVSASANREFIKKVNEGLQQGFVLIGGVCVTQVVTNNLTQNRELLLTQAMAFPISGFSNPEQKEHWMNVNAN